MAVLLATTFILGWRRKLLPFETLLLLAGVFVAFRARRDVWFLTVGAVGILASTLRSVVGTNRTQYAGRIAWTVAVCLSFVVYGFSQARNINEKHLRAIVAQTFPVGAVGFVKENRLRGPLFNDFDWGGFLIWSLPNIPVVMDGRVNLYGDARFEQSLATWAGRPGWQENPDLQSANVVIAPRNRPLTDLLRQNPRFSVKYEDGVAVVFVAPN